MQFDHRSLLSGQSKGVIASATRTALHVVSFGYAIAARFRRNQYDTGRKPISKAEVPVISVGNLTTGGTGKTPIVCDLCVRLRAMGYRVSIVSRGFGAGESGINDEAMEIADRLPDVPHVQHPDRVEAARIAVEELEAEVIVMDDGFQHRRLHRDLDIVVIDATCPFGYGHLLPRGYLREPISSLRRADVVMITRTDQVNGEAIEQIQSQLKRFAPSAPVIQTLHRPTSIGFQHSDTQTVDWLRKRSVALVSAIGNPSAFEQTVVACGATVQGHYRLPDHDDYDRNTREQIRNWASELQTETSIDALICTHKDYVKLTTDQIAGIQLGYLIIELKISEPDREAWLDAELRELVKGETGSSAL